MSETGDTRAGACGMGERRSTASGDAPGRERGPDISLWIVAVLVAVGGFVYVSLGGLAAPREVVFVGMGCYVLLLGEMVRRLRAGDPYALAVPVVALAVWTVLLFIGLLLLGWTP